MKPARRAWLVALAALLAVAATARLGWWQLQRAQQKQDMQRQVDQRQALPPLAAGELARTADQVPGQVQRQVQVSGRWRVDRSIYLDNRQMNRRVGFYVLTPLELAPGDVVLVQRGWVPRDPRDREALPALPRQDGEVKVVARIIPEPSRLFELQAGDAGLIRQNLDVQAYARETGLNLRPLVLLQLQPSAENDFLQRAWPVAASDLAKHHGYAFQWFALCALIAGLYVWFQLIRPRRHAARRA
jgi:surfeit locus 1 family protein